MLVLFLQQLLLQQVYDLETSELIHIINATDPINGDWTRYVNCARYLEEQNLVSVQDGTQVFYKAIRVSSSPRSCEGHVSILYQGLLHGHQG